MPKPIILNGVRIQVTDNEALTVQNPDGTNIGGGGGGGSVAVATANPPTYTEGAAVPLSVDLGGTLRSTAGAGGGGGITQVGNAATGAATNVGYGTSQLKMPVDGSSVTQPVSAASLPLPTGAATEASLGTDGATPPTIPGTGIRGWLRSIYDKLAGTLVTDPIDRAARLLGHVTVDNASLPVTGTFWQATQPVSGTVTANVGTTNGLALDATLTGGTAKAVARGGAKGTTTAADVTSTASGANHQPLDAILYDASGNVLLGQKTMAGSVPVAIASDQSAVPENVTQLGGSGTQLTGRPGFMPVSLWFSNGSNVMNEVGFAAGQDKLPVQLSGLINTVPTTSTFALPVVLSPNGPVTANQGTANTAANAWPAKLTDGTNVTAVKAASTATVAADPSTVVALSPNSISLITSGGTGTPTPVGYATGHLSMPVQVNNVAVKGASTPAAAADQSFVSALSPNSPLVGLKPFTALGFYAVSGDTGTYGGLAANTPLFSFRWGDATRFAVILKVEVVVFTTVAANPAGITERQLIVARSFSASDTGGTALTPTLNNQKRRTSMGTSLATDIRIGNPLTAGTRTLDTNPMARALGWSALNHTGPIIGAQGAAASAAAWSTAGSEPIKLLDAVNGQDYPIVLAQNEGIIVRIGVAQPTTSTQETWVNVVWAEVASY